MATKPTIADARWATDGGAELTAPSSGLRDSGFVATTPIVADYVNVEFKEFYKWALYLSDGALTGDHSVAGNFSTTKSIAFSGVISPSAITGSVDNYAPTSLADAIAIRQDLSAAATLTGLTGGASGRLLILTNIHASLRLTLAHDVTSTAANRFTLPGAVSYFLDPGQSVLLRYDATSSRWRVVAGTGMSAKSRTRTYAVDGFSIEVGTPANIGSLIAATGSGDVVDIPISGLEIGERITACRIRGNDASAGSFCRGELFRRSTGSATQVGADLDTSTGGTGSYNVANTGLTEDVLTDRTYFLRWTSGAASDSIQIIEITTEPTP